jgi:response regulator of citrate/malate metabolism
MESTEVQSDKNILIVDDDRDIADIIADTIDSYFDNVLQAYDLASAIAMADKYELTLITLDIHLAEDNGAALIKHIASNEDHVNFSCPVILISGYITDGFKEKMTGRFLKSIRSLLI